MNKNALCCPRALLKADLFPVMSMKIPLRQVQVIHGESSLWHLKGDCDAETNCVSLCCIFIKGIPVLESCIQEALNIQIWSGFGSKSQCGRQEVYLFGSISFKIQWFSLECKFNRRI